MIATYRIEDEYIDAVWKVLSKHYQNEEITAKNNISFGTDIGENNVVLICEQTKGKLIIREPEETKNALVKKINEVAELGNYLEIEE